MNDGALILRPYRDTMWDKVLKQEIPRGIKEEISDHLTPPLFPNM